MQTNLPKLYDTDRALVRRLSVKLAALKTVEVIERFYADPEVLIALATNRGQGMPAPPPETRERFAYMSGLVVAEVALNRRAAA
jgi:hypothetical protein